MEISNITNWKKFILIGNEIGILLFDFIVQFETEGTDVVELTPNANTVTIKGKAEGVTKITATAVYDGKTTAGTIDVTIDKAGSDISLMSNNEDVAPYGDGFTASIYVGNIEGFIGTVTPNFSVYKNGELVELLSEKLRYIGEYFAANDIEV